MAKTIVKAGLTGNMAFQMDLDGHKFITDASTEIGGENLGPRPKKLLLAGLIGCTGIDVVSILKKMKVEFEDMSLEVEAESSEEHPKVYTEIHLTYRFKGKDLPKDKLERAVSLSQEKYCGVSAMLRHAAPITYDIIAEE
ncbi:MAG: OsmC family protein [Caldicoprobacterales bacterium]|jgi:putative redox protein|nr:OsmC family protein [Clostridiales bacterium]